MSVVIRRRPAKRVMKEFKITAISAVDSPAQEGARAVIMKREEPSVRVIKKKPTQDRVEENEVDDADLLKQAKTGVKFWKSVAALPADQREYFDGLDTADQEDFLAKSSSERALILAKRDEANPIVYEALDGTKFRKSDDPRFIAMAKRADESDKRAAAAEALHKMDVYRKRADEDMSHLPGDTAVHVAVVRAIDGIDDEAVRKSAFEMIKAANIQASSLFKAVGHSEAAYRSAGTSAAVVVPNSPEGRLETLAKGIQKDNPGMSFQKAYTQALYTPEGQEAYNQIRDARPDGSPLQ